MASLFTAGQDIKSGISEFKSNPAAFAVNKGIKAVNDIANPYKKGMDNYRRGLGSGFRNNYFTAIFNFPSSEESSHSLYGHAFEHAVNNIVNETAIKNLYGSSQSLNPLKREEADLMSKEWAGLISGIKTSGVTAKPSENTFYRRNAISGIEYDADITVSFLNDQWNNNYIFWLKYFEAIGDPHQISYKDYYKCNIHITINDNALDEMYKYTYFNCYPKSLPSQDLKYEKVSSAQEFQMTFGFEYMLVENVVYEGVLAKAPSFVPSGIEFGKIIKIKLNELAFATASKAVGGLQQILSNSTAKDTLSLDKGIQTLTQTRSSEIAAITKSKDVDERNIKPEIIEKFKKGSGPAGTKDDTYILLLDNISEYITIRDALIKSLVSLKGNTSVASTIEKQLGILKDISSMDSVFLSKKIRDAAAQEELGKTNLSLDITLSDETAKELARILGFKPKK